MIDILIFHLHILGGIYAFTLNWQKEGLKHGLLGLSIVGLVFAIGWALTGTLAHAIMPYEWESAYFTRDTFSLILLMIIEIIFFYQFFIKNK